MTNLFNFCVFHQVLIRFGLGTCIVLKTKQYEFEMNTATFWLTGPTNRSQPIANLFNFYIFCPIWMKLDMWTTIGQKTTYNKFKIVTATIWLTTTNKTAAQATGVDGVRGRGIEGLHHHPQDFTIFSLRLEPPLLVVYIQRLPAVIFLFIHIYFFWLFSYKGMCLLLCFFVCHGQAMIWVGWTLFSWLSFCNLDNGITLISCNIV